MVTILFTICRKNVKIPFKLASILFMAVNQRTIDLDMIQK